MNGTWGFWFLLGVGLTLGLLGLFVVLTLILRKTGGYAPGWQLRCTACGKTRGVGVVRIGAASAGKRTFGWCSYCGRLRIIAIERKPEVGTAPPASG